MKGTSASSPTALRGLRERVATLADAVRACRRHASRSTPSASSTNRAPTNAWYRAATAVSFLRKAQAFVGCSLVRWLSVYNHRTQVPVRCPRLTPVCCAHLACLPASRTEEQFDFGGTYQNTELGRDYITPMGRCGAAAALLNTLVASTRTTMAAPQTPGYKCVGSGARGQMRAVVGMSSQTQGRIGKCGTRYGLEVTCCDTQARRCPCVPTVESARLLLPDNRDFNVATCVAKANDPSEWLRAASTRALRTPRVAIVVSSLATWPGRRASSCAPFGRLFCSPHVPCRPSRTALRFDTPLNGKAICDRAAADLTYLWNTGMVHT